MPAGETRNMLVSTCSSPPRADFNTDSLLVSLMMPHLYLYVCGSLALGTLCRDVQADTSTLEGRCTHPRLSMPSQVDKTPTRTPAPAPTRTPATRRSARLARRPLDYEVEHECSGDGGAAAPHPYGDVQAS